MINHYIGVDIGGTKCSVVLGDARGGISEKAAFPTETGAGPGQALEKIEAAVELMCSRADRRPLAIGISCGGPLDAVRGVVQSPPNLPGWDDVPVTERLSKAFGMPAFLNNDADACAVAEHRFGAGVGCRNLIFLTFGTGIGAGLILDGRLYSGSTGLAGEVGHIRLAEDGPIGHGKHGSFEGFCSGGGIARLARAEVLRRLAGGEKVGFCPSAEEAERLTAKIVGDAADAGDEVAIAIYRTSGRWLGRGLAVLIDILNPEKIIIGSIFARSRHLLQPAAEEVIREEALSASSGACTIVPPGLGERIGDVAALTVAMRLGAE